MTAELLSGKDLAGNMDEELTQEVASLKEKGFSPKLVVILVGDNPASLSYVKGKEKRAKKVGMDSEIIRLPKETKEEELLSRLDDLNNDSSVHGILVQLPLPEQIDEQKVILHISPAKDVDGFHPVNIGKMLTGQDGFLPCTPYGIIKLIQSKGIEIEGKHAVIVGRSNIVGKPVGQLLLNENATVTYCHSRTKNMKAHTKNADILVVAIGKEHFITSEDVKEGAVIIDVGINRTNDGTLTGDVDFENVKEKVSYITPVPGGVGPMTITMLLWNTLKAAKGLTKLEG
jgi:methylenetetrahydrofolate dehydrogenase (NADP+)/methenyltetrahydrofolate cyclohydrolase